LTQINGRENVSNKIEEQNLILEQGSRFNLGRGAKYETVLHKCLYDCDAFAFPDKVSSGGLSCWQQKLSVKPLEKICCVHNGTLASALGGYLNTNHEDMVFRKL